MVKKKPNHPVAFGEQSISAHSIWEEAPGNICPRSLGSGNSLPGLLLTPNYNCLTVPVEHGISVYYNFCGLAFYVLACYVHVLVYSVYRKHGIPNSPYSLQITRYSYAMMHDCTLRYATCFGNNHT